MVEMMVAEYSKPNNCLYENNTLMWWAVCVNVAVSSILIFVNLFLYLVLRKKRVVLTRLIRAMQQMEDAGQVFEYVRMPARGVVLLSELLQIDTEKMKAAYQRDANERRQVIYHHFGQSSFAKRFANSNKVKFMKTGYAVESAILGRRRT